jgi:hypothetical protein
MELSEGSVFSGHHLQLLQEMIVWFCQEPAIIETSFNVGVLQLARHLELKLVHVILM